MAAVPDVAGPVGDTAQRQLHAFQSRDFVGKVERRREAGKFRLGVPRRFAGRSNLVAAWRELSSPRQRNAEQGARQAAANAGGREK